MHATVPSSRSGPALRRIALALLVCWAVFWTWFNLASGIGELGEPGAGALTAHLLVALATVGAVAIAWRFPRAGAVVLAVLALFALWFFRGATPFVLAILAGPPLLGAALLLRAAIHPRPRAAN